MVVAHHAQLHDHPATIRGAHRVPTLSLQTQTRSRTGKEAVRGRCRRVVRALDESQHRSELGVDTGQLGAASRVRLRARQSQCQQISLQVSSRPRNRVGDGTPCTADHVVSDTLGARSRGETHGEPGGNLQYGDADGEHVSLLSHNALHQFGSHVPKGADEPSGDQRPILGVQLGDAKVPEDGHHLPSLLLPSQQDVLGFNVPVQEAAVQGPTTPRVAEHKAHHGVNQHLDALVLEQTLVRRTGGRGQGQAVGQVPLLHEIICYAQCFGMGQCCGDSSTPPHDAHNVGMGHCAKDCHLAGNQVRCTGPRKVLAGQDLQGHLSPSQDAAIHNARATSTSTPAIDARGRSVPTLQQMQGTATSGSSSPASTVSTRPQGKWAPSFSTNTLFHRSMRRQGSPGSPTPTLQPHGRTRDVHRPALPTAGVPTTGVKHAGEVEGGQEGVPHGLPWTRGATSPCGLGPGPWHVRPWAGTALGPHVGRRLVGGQATPPQHQRVAEEEVVHDAGGAVPGGGVQPGCSGGLGGCAKGQQTHHLLRPLQPLALPLILAGDLVETQHAVKWLEALGGQCKQVLQGNP